MNNLIYVLAAVVIGIGVSLQPPINSVMARSLNSPLFSACISLFISVNAAAVLWLLLDKGNTELAQIRALPWWVICGGLIGLLFVAGSIVVAPVTGIALFFVCVVAGQLIGASVMDQFGLFGLPVKSINITKLIGLLLVIAGAVLVQTSNS